MTMSQMGSTWTRRTRAGWPLLPRLHGVLRRRLRDQVVHLRDCILQP